MTDQFPPGVVVAGNLLGSTYLTYTGADDLGRLYGWYYGFPACCVEAFVRRSDATDDDPCWDDLLLHHPGSGHLLCVACAAGPLAPLPERPAREYGLVFFDDLPNLIPPHDYDSPGRQTIEIVRTIHVWDLDNPAEDVIDWPGHTYRFVLDVDRSALIEKEKA